MYNSKELRVALVIGIDDERPRAFVVEEKGV
jgi:hypothetical protein